MSYSVAEYVEDCKRDVVRARLVATHYPDARQVKISGRVVWCHESALARINGFDVDVTDKGGERWDRYDVHFVPYHELQEGDVRVRVYAAGWEGRMASYDLMARIQQNASLRDALFAVLKRGAT